MEAVNCGTSQVRLSGYHLPNTKHSFTRSYYQRIHKSFSDGLTHDSRRSIRLLTYCSISSSNKFGIEGKSNFDHPLQKRPQTTETCYSSGVCTYDGNISQVNAHATEEKIGVLLLNLGGPETLQDVQPFLFNLFADPANALKVALETKNVTADVYVGMRYWYPFTEEAIHQIKKDKITRLVVLPLYPQFSISTSGSSIRVLKNIFSEDAYLSRLPFSIIESWYEREGYIKSMADLIEKELISFSKPDEVMIFFSAHGVPVSYVEDAGDPYRDQMENCVGLIMKELKRRGTGNSHTLAYQSRVGPVQWLKPYTDEVLVELGQKGVKSLLAVPVSFVSEHIETLEEIDMEYKHLALESGIKNWGRVPALGCKPSFIADLADAVIEALPSASAMSTASGTSLEEYADRVQYAVKMFFGSILAFILLLSPKVLSSLRNFLL